MTTIAYLDCFAGISGDMFLGALLDAGWPEDRLREVVTALKLANVTINVARTSKQGISGTQVTVNAPGDQPARAFTDLVAMVNSANLPDNVKQQTLAALKLLGETEAAIHNVPLEQIHFHELGAVDTLVDIVGTFTGLHDLNVAQVLSAPLPWSQGTVKTAHGLLPVPPPAVAALMQGLPVIGVDVQGEMVTPTGAVLVRSLAEGFGPIPAMRVERVGYGAGQRDWPDRPNLLRLVIGELTSPPVPLSQKAGEGEPVANLDPAPLSATRTGGKGLGDRGVIIETLTILSCNLDDMNPQWYGPLIQALFEAHALDVWLTPVQMKKSRPATVVEVLCKPFHADTLMDLLFQHTTTLGVRQQSVSRYSLARRFSSVETPYGPVRVKIATLPDGSERIAPEHDDCAARAAEHGVSIREVWLAAFSA